MGWLRPMAREPLLSALLFLGVALSRLPFISQKLNYYDSVHYALALKDYDILHHQPQPPGSIFFVLMGRLVQGLIPEPNSAFIAINIVASGLAVVVLYHFGREVFDKGKGLLAALLLTTSPLVWFYGEITSIYPLELLFSTLIASLCHRTVKGEAKSLLWSALLLGIAGGIRQSTMVFLLPLWLYSLKGQPLKRVCTAGVILFLASMAWFIPQAALAGGVEAYLRAVQEQNALNLSRTSLFVRGAMGLLESLLGMAAGLFNALQIASIPIILLLLRLFPFRGNGGLRGVFLILWIGPAALYFALFHFWELGYVGIFLPPIFLYLPSILESFARDLRARLGGARILALRRTAGYVTYSGTMVFVLLMGIAWFTMLPSYFSYHAIREKDKMWRRIDDLGSNFLPGSALILVAFPDLDIFRHLQYYLPQHPTYLVGWSSEGRLGWGFKAYVGRSDYGFLSNVTLRERIPLEPGVEHLMVFDTKDTPLVSEGSGSQTIRLDRKRLLHHISLEKGGEGRFVTFARGVAEVAGP